MVVVSFKSDLVTLREARAKMKLGPLMVPDVAEEDEATGEPGEPKLDEDGNPIPEDEKVDVTLPDDFMAKLQQLNAIYQMMMDMMTAE